MARGTINTRVKADAKEFKAEMKAVAGAIENISKQLTASNQSFGLFSKNTKGVVTDLAQIGAGSISIFKEIKGIFGSAAQSFTQTADAINTMNARLAQSTKSTAHFTALRAGIDKIAKSTYSSSESISNLFINVNQSLSEMGLSQKNALEMSETLSKALRVGGASAVDAERAITQFSQALSTGKLQGQDFKAMIGAAPILLKNMADALGVTTGELRTMASEGQLTNEKLVEAFSNMKDSVDNAFSKMPVSVADATQLMSNSINGLIENLNIAMSATGSMSYIIQYWANMLERATPTISAFVNEVIGVFAQALLGLEGICKSFVLAGLDVLWLLNHLNVVNGVEIDKWIDSKRAEYSLEAVASKIEDVRAKTASISLEIYNKASSGGDIAALNTTKEEKSFAKENRAKFLAKIQVNDYDAVIMSAEQFKLIPKNPEKTIANLALRLSEDVAVFIH
ncbi:MAG: tape measure protein [Campylobacter sp.]|nr:tape measure protein [Campylobacter sp.]